MARLGVTQKDIEESFIRSSKPGGQNANKVATCVYLRHIPTGIEVKCRQERTQSLNRCLALEILISKIENSILRKRSQQQKQRQEALRSQRRRSTGAKARILEEKHRHSQKKERRRPIREINND